MLYIAPEPANVPSTCSMNDQARNPMPRLFSFTFIVVAFGLSSLGCFSLKYHMPSSNTPAAVVSVVVPATFLSFDVFHSEDGCPRSNPTVWNSDYLGSIEIRYPNQSFDIPGSGYTRFALRGSGPAPGQPYSNMRYNIDFIIASNPGAHYILVLKGTELIFHSSFGQVAPVTCEDDVPVRQKPKEERMASRSTPIQSSMLSTLP